MQLVRISGWKAINDDGSPAGREADLWISEMAESFMCADILGPNSPLQHGQAMRMAMVVWEQFAYRHIGCPVWNIERKVNDDA